MSINIINIMISYQESKIKMSFDQVKIRRSVDFSHQHVDWQKISHL